MAIAGYPDGISGGDICFMEGCVSPNCRRCGRINYAALGYMGYIGRMAKKWGVSKDEAEFRIMEVAEATPDA